MQVREIDGLYADDGFIVEFLLSHRKSRNLSFFTNAELLRKTIERFRVVFFFFYCIRCKTGNQCNLQC